MKKAIAINGSPRKNGNTAALLQKALDGARIQGAEVELIHLIDCDFKGCVSCFACKRKGAEFIGGCAYKDGLTPILEKAASADAVIVGSPIYIGDVTSMTRSFMERFFYPRISYGNKENRHKTDKKSTAFIYTMNASKLQSKMFFYIYLLNKGLFKKFGGYSARLLSTNTLQFDDYSLYDAANFNEHKKKENQSGQIPEGLRKGVSNR
ncbi:MAG: flavodoxin family protein [Clostridiales bacterium]|jgi:multimeric flavodoxin WrbA|nr:flavodoxin family protein [Clostridiales bacterium]